MVVQHIIIPVPYGIADQVYIIGVHAPPEIRYERLVKRGREDAPKNLDEFHERDDREMGWGLGNVIALSDYMIVNDSDLDSFKDNVKRTLEALR